MSPLYYVQKLVDNRWYDISDSFVTLVEAEIEMEKFQYRSPKGQYRIIADR